MIVSTVGIDLAKNVFQLHGVNELGKTVFKKQLRRDQMAEFFVNLPACLIGMEACGVTLPLTGTSHNVKHPLGHSSSCGRYLLHRGPVNQ